MKKGFELSQLLLFKLRWPLAAPLPEETFISALPVARQVAALCALVYIQRLCNRVYRNPLFLHTNSGATTKLHLDLLGFSRLITIGPLLSDGD
jgi:hypothetical protein